MFLLDTGESPNIKSLKSMSVQFEAIIIRDDDEVTEMLQDKYKGDINSHDAQGYTVAHYALLDNYKAKTINKEDHFTWFPFSWIT